VKTRAKDPVYDWLAYYAEFDPGRIAAVDLATGRWLTYGTFNDRATRLATALRDEHGVRPFDRVAFVAQNSTDHFEAMFACWKLGAMFVPLNWRLSPYETVEVVKLAEPRVLLCDAELEPHLEGDATPRVLRRPGDPGCAYERLVAGHAPAARMQDVDFDMPNMLLFTSGTTGRPKGVIYTHRMTHNIVVHAALHARVRAHARTLTYLPLFHSAGLYAVSTPQFHYGGAVVVMRSWDTRECFRHLMDPDLRITHVVGVPTNYQLLSELPEFEQARFPFLEVAAVGGAPVPLHLLEIWERKGCELSQSFGLTEAFSVSYCPPEKAHEKIGSAGHALMHVEVRIGDADGNELPRNAVGEIQVRGPGVTPGYWNDPQATAEAFTADGFLRTGDAARMTDDGTIYVVDRLKDMIISGGENIYPAEVEEAIASLDEVSQCAVIGVPDPRWGEVGLALVLLKPGCTLDAAAVLARCAERLAKYKVPKQVEFVGRLPLSPQGKVLKTELRRAYAAATAGG
jgi:fatty-acyl-CoA synthase